MTIVRVRPARRSLVKLLIDNGEEYLVDKKTWEESVYTADSSLTMEQLDELLALSDRRRAESRAVFLLSKRDLSRRELENKLCREKGRYVPQNREIAQQTADRMQELGFVNDETYAQRLAERYCRERVYPKRRAVQALQAKGIDREIAKEAVELLNVTDEELALEFLQKKRYTVDSEGAEDRIFAAMERYGFGYEDSRRAYRRWTEEQNE